MPNPPDRGVAPDPARAAARKREQRSHWSLPILRPPATSRSFKVMLLLSSTLMLFGASPAGQVTPAEYARRQSQLERMTAEERTRLERNFTTWKNLTPAARDRYRNLHEQLEQSANAQLETLFDDYIAWLDTLSIAQREEIRRETDPVQRATLVEKLYAAQRGTGGGLRRLQIAEGDLLKPADLQAVFARIESELKERRDPLMMGRGPERVDPRMRLLFATLKSKSSGEIADAAIAAITEDQLRKRLESATDSSRPLRLFLLLTRTLAAENVARIPDPTADEGRAILRPFFELQDAKLRGDLMRLPPDQFWGRLLQLYVQETREFPPMLLQSINMANRYTRVDRPMSRDEEDRLRQMLMMGRDGPRGFSPGAGNRPGQNPSRDRRNGERPPRPPERPDDARD